MVPSSGGRSKNSSEFPVDLEATTLNGKSNSYAIVVTRKNSENGKREKFIFVSFE